MYQPTRKTHQTPVEPNPFADTQPVHVNPNQPNSLAETRLHKISPPTRRRKKSLRWTTGCLVMALMGIGLLAPILAYLLAPARTNVLILGIDSRPGEGNTGRSDTIILTTVLPLQPYVGALSIPRDLWVTIPGRGENRINTAHFFGEVEKPGGGPPAAMQAIQANFGVTVDHFVRIRFDGLREMVDALGGVEISFPSPMSGYPAGVYHLNGEQALAFVRDRQGSDDFFRMERGQLFLKSIWRQLLNPLNWPHLPSAYSVLLEAVDTDVPVYLWPRLGFALLRAGPDGIDTRAITREMVTPFTTDGGAQVLEPRWDAINPILWEVFGQ